MVYGCRGVVLSPTPKKVFGGIDFRFKWNKVPWNYRLHFPIKVVRHFKFGFKNESSIHRWGKSSTFHCQFKSNPSFRKPHPKFRVLYETFLCASLSLVEMLSIRTSVIRSLRVERLNCVQFVTSQIPSGGGLLLALNPMKHIVNYPA